LSPSPNPSTFAPSKQSQEFFVFIDETGVLSKANQRFFGLGLMKLNDTAPLTELVHAIFQRVQGSARLGSDFEFKFTDVTGSSLPYYLDLVDAYFALPTSHFCALVMDKRSPSFDWAKFFPTVWDAYIGYSKLMLRRNTGEGETVCVLSDYLGKPKDSPKYYETELRTLSADVRMRGSVFNVCMLESHASLLIQVVDVLLGATRYDHQRRDAPDTAQDPAKLEVAERVRGHLGWDTLAQKKTKWGQRYFSVWPFESQVGVP
jgi:hypothetical protein